MVQTSFGRNIRECPVAIVVEERVAVNSPDEQIGITIVVIVGDGRGDVVASAAKTSFFRYVGEHPVAVVAVKMVGEFGGILLESLDIGAVCEKYVRPAILVVVKHRDTTSHGCRSMGSLQSFVGLHAKGQVFEGESDFGRDGRSGLGVLRNGKEKRRQEKNQEWRETAELYVTKRQPKNPLSLLMLRHECIFSQPDTLRVFGRIAADSWWRLLAKKTHRP